MARVLLLGKDRERTGGVRHLLREDGHDVVVFRDSLARWRARERETHPDLVVAAVEYPREVLIAHGKDASGFPAPLLFVQHEHDLVGEADLDTRLVDRISSPFLGEELLARVEALISVKRILRHRSPRERRPMGWIGRMGRGVRALLGRRIPPHEKPRGPFLEVAARLADWADGRDAFEPGHAERVTSFCAMIAEGLELGDDAVSALLRAAMLHDVGKVAIPVELLHRPGPLDEPQMRLIRTHPKRGAALLRVLDRDEQVTKTVLYHHERPDGEGYYGLPAEEIPRTASILAVAECYDAMTSSRVREPLPRDKALGYLHDTRNTIHDADCVDALVDKLKPTPRTIPLVSSLELSRGPGSVKCPGKRRRT